jgi:hypothetical protein
MPVQAWEEMYGLSHDAWLKQEDHEKDLKKRAKWRIKKVRITSFVDKRAAKRKKMPRKAGSKAKYVRQSDKHAYEEDQQGRQDYWQKQKQQQLKFNKQRRQKQEQAQEERQRRQQAPSLSSGEDPYAVLELHRPAKLCDVKTAFRKQIKVWHPDLARSSMEKASYLEQAQLITEAYDVLKQSLARE